jgi:hypothetical protein
VERPLAAGDALDQQTGFVIDQDTHVVLLRDNNFGGIAGAGCLVGATTPGRPYQASHVANLHRTHD